MIEAKRHYRACVETWAEHIEACHQCKMAIESRGRLGIVCETGAACQEEVSIAAHGMVEPWPQHEEAA